MYSTELIDFTKPLLAVGVNYPLHAPRFHAVARMNIPVASRRLDSRGSCHGGKCTVASPRLQAPIIKHPIRTRRPYGQSAIVQRSSEKQRLQLTFRALCDARIPTVPPMVEPELLLKHHSNSRFKNVIKNFQKSYIFCSKDFQKPLILEKEEKNQFINFALKRFHLKQKKKVLLKSLFHISPKFLHLWDT